MLAPWKKSWDKPRQHIKSRHPFADKDPYGQSYGFHSSHVQMGALGHKEGWVLKNSCFWTVLLQKTLASPLGSTGIKQVNPKGNKLNINQKDWCWIWSSSSLPTLMQRADSLEKTQDAGESWRQEEKGTTEDGDGWKSSLTQWTRIYINSGIDWRIGALECLSSWGHKKSDTA